MDMDRKDTIVIDLDGTLANIDHRLSYIRTEKPDWDTFYDKCDIDICNEWCKKLIDGIGLKYFIVIVSGRRKSVYDKTQLWLKDNDVIFDKLLLLRNENDFTPDQELKRKWLYEYGKDRILFVIDDRQRVVDMWRKEGLVCLQCYAWKEYKSCEYEK